MSTPEKKEQPPTQEPVCSFDYKKLTPWDPCWEQYKHTMVPTQCGRLICKHHWLSHVMLECGQCNQQQMPAIKRVVAEADVVRKAIEGFEVRKEETRNKKW